MGLFSNKDDPISERARELSAEIAALEAKIKKLDEQASSSQSRSAVATPAVDTATVRPSISLKGREPVFEQFDQERLKNSAEPLATAQHFNDLGVRKYDLVALIDRIKKNFQGPPLSNPKLVNYLAAGSVQGLRPLRYEKRVARNRFFLVTLLVAAVMLGLFVVFLRHH